MAPPPERWQRIDSLYDSAVQRKPELRRELELLLAEASSFLCGELAGGGDALNRLRREVRAEYAALR
jgi:hypothetical protein